MRPSDKSTSSRPDQRGTAWLGNVIERLVFVGRGTARLAAPVFDLALRLAIARVFIVSAIIKLADWDNALALSQNEYPVTWMDPVTAAYLGVAIELVGSILLAIGLATRGAALALLVLALVIQFNYLPFDVHLFWAVLCAWFVVRGAGPLSLDHSLARGLAASALPLAGPTVRALERITRITTPFYLFGLRAWLALAVLAALGIVAPQPSLFAIDSARAFVGATVLACAMLLVAGVGSRIVALVWMLAVCGWAISDPNASHVTYWMLTLGLLMLYGPGPIAIDHGIRRALGRFFPQLDGKPAFALAAAARVIIVGAGFGGIACAARLARERVQVTVVDRRNYHLFQPLLYQVATAALAPGDIAAPVRGVFRDAFNVRVLLGTVVDADTAKNEVVLESGQRLPYDYLVLASGASHSYFGRDDWAPFAPGLKRVEDATEVRRRLLTAFEQAEATDDPIERQALLTFLIVGGGPTGVELAGAIAELAKLGMEKEFRRFDPASANVVLVQSGARLLPAFPEKLSAITQASLEKLGVTVHLNSKVESIDARGVIVSGRRIASRTVLWAAGVAASPAAKWIKAPTDNAGRIKVGADLTVPALPNVFAIGDTAASSAWDGQPVPGLAPAAKQGGAHVARVITARLHGSAAPGAFRYRHMGSLATIGRKAAVADFGFVRLSGTLAWWLWGVIHVGFLLGMRNRVSVMFDWFWAYLTYKSSTRLITGGMEQPVMSVVRSNDEAVRSSPAQTISSPVPV